MKKSSMFGSESGNERNAASRVSNGFKLRRLSIRLQLAALFAVLSLAAFTAASGATVKTTQTLMLGDTPVTVSIYENPGANVTFFSPHHNELIAISVAKEYVERKGGRFVEIESFSPEGKPLRNLSFKVGEASYVVDPNRIYTDNGRNCSKLGEAAPIVKTFADELLKLILGPDGKSVRDGESFVVAIHNNLDVSPRPPAEKEADLNALAYLRSADLDMMPQGAYSVAAAGVYFSNMEPDLDNFVYLSTPKYLSFFAQYNFNVIVQRPAAYLKSIICSVDDGSLSVYAGQNSIPYICLEADWDFGRSRQSLMFEAVYKLASEQKPAAREIVQPAAAGTPR